MNGVRVFICKDVVEWAEYLAVYPVLLDLTQVFYADESVQKIEGMRISQLFVTSSVSAKSELVFAAHQIMIMMSKNSADTQPVFLHLPLNGADRKAQDLQEGSCLELWKQAENTVYPIAVRLKFAMTALEFFGKDYKDDQDN